MKYRIYYDGDWKRWVLHMRAGKVATTHHTFDEARAQLWRHLSALAKLSLVSREV